MTITDLAPLLGRREVLLAGLVLSVLALIWMASKVRRFARSERPDDALSTWAMLIGLGWSSEVIWEITRNRLHFPLGLTLLLFCVLELQLILAMIRAKRHMREFSWPGRYGTTAWTIAAVMATVATVASHSLAEAVLRAAIPLLVTKAWWDGLVGGAVKRPESATTWRWTPRRLLLAVGAVEPGERDVETINRERVTQQMTRLEHRRRHGWVRLSGRRAARLARLSLTADDEMIAEVRRRVDRATWFDATQEMVPQPASHGLITAAAAASARARRVRHGRSLRRIFVTHPRPVIVAAQEPRSDQRETHEIDSVVRVIRDAHPRMPQRQIARLACVSEPTVRRALRRNQNASPPPSVNGQRPELEDSK